MNLPLRDIKPNVLIIDYEWWAFIAFLVILTILLIFFIYRFLKNRKKENKALIILKNLDFTDSKKTAYEFSRYAREFINEKNKDQFDEIVKKLNRFKYKPDVPPIDKDLENEIKNFIRNIK